MKRIARFALVLMLIFWTKVGAAADPLSSLVIITSLAPKSIQLAMGTGTIISPDGDILTAYHVVQGASGITVSMMDQHTFHDITVVKWDTQRDLAVLHINDAGAPWPVYPLAPANTDIEPSNAEVYGHPGGYYFQQYPAPITHTLMKSREFHDTKTFAPIFAIDDISLIPLGLTVALDGLSGGPLVMNGAIIGVISGSLSESGTIAWAIPVSPDALAAMTAVGKPPSAIHWPNLSLMVPGLKMVRAEVGIGINLSRSLDAAGNDLDPLAQLLPAVEKACGVYRGNIANLLAELDQEKVVNPDELFSVFTADPAKSAAWPRVNESGPKCFAAVNQFDVASNALTNALNEAQQDLMDYLSKLPDTPKNESLDQQMGEEGRVNFKTATENSVESNQFAKAVANLTIPVNPDLVAARQYWENSDLATSFLVPDEGPGIFRKQYELDLTYMSQFKVLFQYDQPVASAGTGGAQ